MRKILTQREALFLQAGPAAPRSFVVRGLGDHGATARIPDWLLQEALVESGQPILLRALDVLLGDVLSRHMGWDATVDEAEAHTRLYYLGLLPATMHLVNADRFCSSSEREARPRGAGLCRDDRSPRTSFSDHHPATMSADPLISAIRHRRISPDRDQRYNSGLCPRPGWPSCLPCPFIRGGNAEAGRHRESGSSAGHLLMAADKRTEIQVAPGSAHILRIVGGAKNDRRSKSGFGWHVPATQWRFPHREVGPLQQLPGGHKVRYGYAVTHKGR